MLRHLTARYAWLGLLLTTACRENVVAPGACPDFCPVTQVDLKDSLFSSSIVRDSSYRGYVNQYEAARMQVSVGGTTETRAIMRFAPFKDSLQVGTSASALGAVVASDSFRLTVTLARRAGDVQGLEVGVFRLPRDIDSVSTFEALEPFFSDSTRIGTLAIPDTVSNGSVSAVLPGDAFPTLEADSLVAAIGLALSNPTGFADFVTINANSASGSLTRYAQVDSADGQTAAREDPVDVVTDNFVFPASEPPPGSVLSVGGAPAARAIIRVLLPPAVVDSSDVLRATLLMVPSEPVRGAPGDTVFVRAMALATDVGPKSPTVAIDIDTLTLGMVDVIAGTTDTISIEITHIVRSWSFDPNRPRSFILLAERESVSLAELRFHSSSSPVGRPTLRVTYAPPVSRGGL